MTWGLDIKRYVSPLLPKFAPSHHHVYHKQMLLLLSIYLPRRMPLQSGDGQCCRSLSQLRTVFGTRVVQYPNLSCVVQVSRTSLWILLCLHFRSGRQKAHFGLETYLASDTDEQLVVGAEFNAPVSPITRSSAS